MLQFLRLHCTTMVSNRRKLSSFLLETPQNEVKKVHGNNGIKKNAHIKMRQYISDLTYKTHTVVTNIMSA